MGLMFQIIFAVRLNILPLYGRMDPMIQLTFDSPTNFYVLDAILTNNWPALGSAVSHLVLPSITLGLALSGVFVRLTRVNMIEILQSDFITAGRARGISEKVLAYRHALRNTFIPILTLLGLQFAILIAGAVLLSTAVCLWLILRTKKGEKIFAEIFDRISILSYLYLALDLAGIIIIVLRNFSEAL